MTKISRKNAVMNTTPAPNVKAITDSTKKYLLNQMKELGEKNIFLGQEIEPELAYSKIQKIQQLLNRPSFIPEDQIINGLVGNAFKGHIDGNKETEHVIFLEGPVSLEIKLPANHKIIPSDSPFGMALIGQQIGKTVTYRAAGSLRSFEITGLIPYSEAKEIFFPVNQKITVETKTEAEVMV